MSRGPKPDPYRAFTRRTFEEWSDRTFATYWRANRTLAELVEMGAMAEDQRRAVLASAIRPNGTINVCKFARNSDAALIRAMTDHPSLFGD